jgi:hypothetical protein
MSEQPPFPRAGTLGVGGWAPQVKSYIDWAAGNANAPGAPVPLTPIAPAIALDAYPSLLFPNGDGTVTLSGGIRINEDPGGERRIFTPDAQYLPAKNETHPVAATIEGANPTTIMMAVNAVPGPGPGGGLFLIYPPILAGTFALVWLDAVTYRTVAA